MFIFLHPALAGLSGHCKKFRVLFAQDLIVNCLCFFRDYARKKWPLRGSQTQLNVFVPLTQNPKLKTMNCERLQISVFSFTTCCNLNGTKGPNACAELQQSPLPLTTEKI